MLKICHWKTFALSLILLLPYANKAQSTNYTFDGTNISVIPVAHNAYRVKAKPQGATEATDMFYLTDATYVGENTGGYSFDPTTGLLTFTDTNGNTLLKESSRKMLPEGACWSSSLTMTTPVDEVQIGTGQFQDGYLDIKGLSRRLTQVNTQIALPMFISNKGYGVLWNNCGMTEFNPCDNHVELIDAGADVEVSKVDVTGTTGNRQEERRTGTFTATIQVPVDGEYALLLDCGQQMARKHYLEIDGKVLTEANNLWLPPTTSAKAHLNAGTHQIVVKGEKNDRPTLYWRLDDGTTTLASPVSQGIDYTVFIGTPDEIMATIRQLTGQVPMMPRWAFGYIHCRERYDTQAELLENASEFRNRNIPIDMIVQDWQWWGDNGWNAMVFDSRKYPDPKAMTDSLHAMDMRIMLSVWAKVDKSSVLGKEFENKGYYIPGTDWIDFFNDEAAEAYWTAYRDNLVPTGIDAWWQDATEPENDDLKGRMVNNGLLKGDEVRNVFPIAVNDRVYKGLCESRPATRPMIMTRSAAPGIQRYGVMTWSGDVGNDWQTLKRQITGGLGQMACGLPWWTYDAGGFFRPHDQYNNVDYQKRMLRWIQASVFLPFMRVHGYMSQTEPWRYSDETYQRYIESIRLRYQLLPYIYSEAMQVSKGNSTLMRPLMFDFSNDKKAASNATQYMLGRNLLVCPVTGPENIMYVYLPHTQGGWYDMFDNRHYSDSGNVKISLSDTNIPVFVKAGAILPMAENVGNIKSSTDVAKAKQLTLCIYPGADGNFTLYDDDGVSNEHQNGMYSKITLNWDDTNRTLTISKPEGKYKTPVKRFNIILPDGTNKTVKNKQSKIKF